MSAIARQRVIRFLLNMNAMATESVDRDMLEDLLNSWEDDTLQWFAEMVVAESKVA